MSLGDPALVACAKAIAAACSTQQSPCRRKRCRRRSPTRECRGSWRRRRQMVSRLWSGFRHPCHEPDVNAQRRAGCLFPSFASTKLVKAILRLLESRGLESATFGFMRSQTMSRLLLNMSRENIQIRSYPSSFGTRRRRPLSSKLIVRARVMERRMRALVRPA